MSKDIYDQEHNYTDTSKCHYDRFQTTKTQFVGDSLRDVLRASTVCRKEESNKGLNWLKREIDLLHNNYKTSRQNTIEERTSYQDWLDGGLMVFKVIDNLIDQVETMQRPELPVIPSHVAEWLEKHKEQDLYWLLNTLYQHVTEIDDWFVNNVEKLIEAKRYGYTVKENKQKDGLKDSPTEVTGRQGNMLRLRTAQITNDSIRKALNRHKEDMEGDKDE